MNRRIFLHEDVSLDLHEHFSYLAQNNRARLQSYVFFALAKFGMWVLPNLNLFWNKCYFLYLKSCLKRFINSCQET